MPSTPTAPGRTCPNCHAFVPQARSQCGACKLLVSQMDAFAAAKKAARERGIKSTKVDDNGPSLLARSIKPVALILILGLIAGAIFYFTRPGPPFWLKLPATKQDAVTQFLTHIDSDLDKDYDAAYAMIAPEARNPQADDERGQYRQLFHVMYQYLAGEFGSDWITTLKLKPDPVDSDLLIASIGLETLHIRVRQQTPADKLETAGPHYGIMGVDEFDPRDAQAMQSDAARMGVIGGLAGQGAVDNIKTIMGAMGGAKPNERPIVTKLRLLPILRDPHQTTRRTVIQAWTIRKDPVTRARLEAISTDGRYGLEIQNTAQEVLKETLSEEDRAAAGVRD